MNLAVLSNFTMTAVDPVRAHARARAHALAIVDIAEGRRLDWAALDAAVDRAAAWLCAALGPASGARVAFVGRNSADLLITQLACGRAGAVFAPINWRLAPPEIAALFEDAAPRIVILDEDFQQLAPLADAVSAAVYLRGAGGLDALIGPGVFAPCPAEARLPFDAPMTLLFTSGTSGRPKGVIITEQSAFWGAINFALVNAVGPGSVFLCDMPMFHTAGLFAATRTPVLMGGTVHISRGFDCAETLARLQDPALGITHYFAVPQMAQRLWAEPGFDPARLARLTGIFTGGAPNPEAQVRRFIEAGVMMVDGFGMSETSSTFGMPLDRAVISAKAGSCGLPLLTVEASVVDDDGRPVRAGETGELWIRGPNVTPGYWNRPEETARAFAPGGWFRTGDAARQDGDGYYWIVDRKKDMFISGGENVYPAEVEAVITELEAVAEVAVVGMADERWGEVGCAHIVLRPDRSVGAEEVLSHCRGRLAGYKVPKSVRFAESLPRTASGKVQKHILAGRVPAGAGAA